jgi:hypothetical protein
VLGGRKFIVKDFYIKLEGFGSRISEAERILCESKL